MSSSNNSAIPSFRDFIQFVLSRGVYFNRHVWPLHYKCGYCDIHYNFIGKVETMGEDVELVMERGGIDRRLFPPRLHGSSGGRTEDLARQFFAQLDTDTVDRLYKLYQLDFDMFGYSVTDII